MADEQEGKIVTPLPPDMVKKVEGIVTPKPPIQFDREYNAHLHDMPEELKELEDA